MKLLKPNYPVGHVMFFIVFVVCSASADEDPMTPMYDIELSEPRVDLSARPLAGKVIRYDPPLRVPAE